MAVHFMVSRTGDYFKVLKNWSIVFFSYMSSHHQGIAMTFEWSHRI